MVAALQYMAGDDEIERRPEAERMQHGKASQFSGSADKKAWVAMGIALCSHLPVDDSW